MRIDTGSDVIRKRIVVPIFLVVVVVAYQLVVAPMRGPATDPATLGEDVLRFRTAPVEAGVSNGGPGVLLRFEATSGPIDPSLLDEPVERGSLLYAWLERDEQGFARVSRVAARARPDGPFLRVEARAIRDGRVHFAFPLDHYVVAGNGASSAVNGVRHAHWAEVRVREGRAVIEGVYVDGERIDPRRIETAARPAHLPHVGSEGT